MQHQLFGLLAWTPLDQHIEDKGAEFEAYLGSVDSIPFWQDLGLGLIALLVIVVVLAISWRLSYWLGHVAFRAFHLAVTLAIAAGLIGAVLYFAGVIA